MITPHLQDQFELKTPNRVCGALIRSENILMVRHLHAGFDYWTLPGGGVEPDEPPSAAIQREVWEETGLRVEVGQVLFGREFNTKSSGRHIIEVCFYLTMEGEQQPQLGYDPELSSENQMICAVAWQPLAEVQADIQVAGVIQALETHFQCNLL